MKSCFHAMIQVLRHIKRLVTKTMVALKFSSFRAGGEITDVGNKQRHNTRSCLRFCFAAIPRSVNTSVHGLLRIEYSVLVDKMVLFKYDNKLGVSLCDVQSSFRRY